MKPKSDAQKIKELARLVRRLVAALDKAEGPPDVGKRGKTLQCKVRRYLYSIGEI
jgi:hypothetical protein